MGADGVLVLNSGSLETPTWNEMLNLRDLEWSLSYSDVEVSSRIGGGYKMHEPALGDIAFSTEHLHDPADTQLATLRDAALGPIAVDLAIMDGEIDETGSQGFRMRVKAFDFKRAEMLDGIMSQAFDWKLCYSATPPEYLIIGA